jgi:UDP-glucose 4-epimerase
MEHNNTWIITGGAGYIGSHIAHELLSNNVNVAIYDSMYRGKKSRVEYLSHKFKKAIPFVEGDIRNLELFSKTLENNSPIGVIHAAGLKSVSESFTKPDEYHSVNTLATRNIVNLLIERKIERLIFSSSAAVYGSTNNLQNVSEKQIVSPISPYGSSKLEAEKEVRRFNQISGHVGISLRFFNVVGAESKALMDESKENLVPIFMNQIRSNTIPTIFGTDFDTADGTCVRDYIDVRDVSKIHLLIANYQGYLPDLMNVGTGIGTSVKEVMNIVGLAVGKTNLDFKIGQRRTGDSGALCADITWLKNWLKFEPNYSLQSSIKELT